MMMITDVHFAADSMCLSSFNFFGGLDKTIFSTRVRFGRSKSSKVIDFSNNRKRVCDFLLVRHSNLFRDIAGFYAHDPTPIPP